MSTASSGLRVRVVTGLRLPQASLGVPPASRRVMAYLRTYGSWRSPRAISDRNVYGTVPATAGRRFRQAGPAPAVSSGCGSARHPLSASRSDDGDDHETGQDEAYHGPDAEGL